MKEDMSYYNPKRLNTVEKKQLIHWSVCVNENWYRKLYNQITKMSDKISIFLEINKLKLLLLLFSLSIGVIANVFMTYTIFDSVVIVDNYGEEEGAGNVYVKDVDGKLDLSKSVIKDNELWMSDLVNREYFHVSMVTLSMVILLIIPVLLYFFVIDKKIKKNTNKMNYFVVLLYSWIVSVSFWIVTSDLFKIENLFFVSKTVAWMVQINAIICFTGIAYLVNSIILNIWKSFIKMNEGNQLKIVVPVVTFILGALGTRLL